MKRATLYGAVVGVPALLLLLGIVAVYLPWPQLTLEEVLDSRILKPIPEHTKIKELYYVNPSLGAGQLLVEIELTEQGLAQLLHLYGWKEVGSREAYQLRSLEVVKEDDSRRIFAYRLSESIALEMVLGDGSAVVLAADGI